MNPHAPDVLENLLSQCGMDWLFRRGLSKDQVLANIRGILDSIKSAAHHRNLAEESAFSERGLLQAHDKNPGHVKAFLQAITSALSPEMLLMVWRVLQGMDIDEIVLQYKSEKLFHLKVILRAPYPDSPNPEVYETDDIYSAALLGHMGIFELDGKPVFSGFLPQPM